MATGMISIGAGLVGYAGLSQVILGMTIAAFVLLLAYAARPMSFGAWMRENVRNPSRRGRNSPWPPAATCS